MHGIKYGQFWTYNRQIMDNASFIVHYGSKWIAILNPMHGVKNILILK